MGIGADGLKTGFTKEAGYGLVGSAVQNGLRLIVVVNGLKSDEGARRRSRSKLLEWGFHSFEARLLFAEGQTIGEAKLYRRRAGLRAAGRAEPVRLMVPRGDAREAHRAHRLFRPGAWRRSRRASAIGMLKVWRGDNLALEVPLQAAEDVGTGSMSQRAFDAATELVIGLFRAGVNRL